ncbi:hypothetical protein FOBRF1_002804 [Fusarium oxysporum]
MAAAPLAKLRPSFSSSRAAMRSSKPTLLGFTSVSPKGIGVGGSTLIRYRQGPRVHSHSGVWCNARDSSLGDRLGQETSQNCANPQSGASSDRLEKSVKVLNRLYEDTQHCTFEAGDIKDAPQDLREHDVVDFNAAVGSTTLEEENILLSVVYRMRAGALVLTRSTPSIKTMAYPVSGAALNHSE